METNLLKVPMIILDWNECAKTFTKLTKNMLCAGFMNKSYDACQVTKALLPPRTGPHPTGAAMQGYPLSLPGRDN